ncbi:MAG: hypothetical protein MJK04_13180 [Psychrosphaera sp.]|nr:hypothetical protein [Psychrosphaera sp.]
MKKQRSILWIASLVIAYFVGYNTKSLPAPNDPQLGYEQSDSLDKVNKTGVDANKATAITRLTMTQKTNSTATNSTATKKPPVVSDVLEALKSLLGNGGQSIDMAAIAESYNLIKKLTEQQLIDALTQLKGDLNNPNNLTPLLLILSQYAQKNPQRSVEFVQDNMSSTRSKMVAMSTIIQSWAKNDPLAAYDWYMTTKENNDSNGLLGKHAAGLSSIFQGLAKRDINDAIEKLADLTGDTLGLSAAVSAMTGELTDKAEFTDFIAKTSEFDDKSARDGAIRTWAMKNPQEMTDWFDTIDDSQDKTALQEKALAGWMMTDPKNAADWYINTAEEKNKQVNADKIVSKWSQSNPEATLQWIGQQAGIDAQKSTQKLLESSAFFQPEFVNNNLELLANVKDKVTISVLLYMAYDRNNKKKAAEFLKQSPYKDELNKTIELYKSYREKNK